MNKRIPFLKLKTLAKNYSNTLTLFPFETKGAIISLEALEAFLAEAKSLHNPKFDAIRIYFVRHELNTPNEAEDHIRKVSEGSNLSQVSLILAPVNIVGRNQWMVEDLKVNNDEVLTLCICHPEDIVTENPVHTGHCPPKPGCQ